MTEGTASDGDAPRAGGGVGLLPGVLLARHGQTNDNRQPIRAQGFRDTPLNAVGLEQARVLAERLAVRGSGPGPGSSALPIASIWCSDLSRARVTAEIVGEQLGLPVRLEPRLREGFRGDWEGRFFVDIAREEPDAYFAWLAAGADFRFPGGESLQEHADRVWAALSEIQATGPLPALAVCHRGSMRTVLCRNDPLGLDGFHNHQIPNTGVVEL